MTSGDAQQACRFRPAAIPSNAAGARNTTAAIQSPSVIASAVAPIARPLPAAGAKTGHRSGHARELVEHRDRRIIDIDSERCS
jgi:hypothetical protein